MIVATLAVGLHLAVYIQLNGWFPTKEKLSVVHVIYHQEWHLLVLAIFSHSELIQWSILMISFVWKSLILEQIFESTSFLVILAVSKVLTSLIYIAVNMGFERVYEDESYNTIYAVGLSGVTLALKVLVTYYSFDLPLKKIFYWTVELAIIHATIRIITPAISITDLLSVQLAGFIAGCLTLIIVKIIQPDNIFIVCNAGKVPVGVEVEKCVPVQENRTSLLSFNWGNFLERRQIESNLMTVIDPGRYYYFHMREPFIGGNVIIKRPGIRSLVSGSKHLQHRRGRGMIITLEGKLEYSKLHASWTCENGTDHKEVFNKWNKD
ncbi:rhomboid-related protein 4-like [Mytilus edulis]|uniref:rhomboid-related protein 4-like n=1 Tax=Mytilus edulis TaxID=6550 RepID=UPI0039F07248